MRTIVWFRQICAPATTPGGRRAPPPAQSSAKNSRRRAARPTLLVSNNEIDLRARVARVGLKKVDNAWLLGLRSPIRDPFRGDQGPNDQQHQVGQVLSDRGFRWARRLRRGLAKSVTTQGTTNHNARHSCLPPLLVTALTANPQRGFQSEVPARPVILRGWLHELGSYFMVAKVRASHRLPTEQLVRSEASDSVYKYYFATSAQRVR